MLHACLNLCPLYSLVANGTAGDGSAQMLLRHVLFISRDLFPTRKHVLVARRRSTLSGARPLVCRVTAIREFMGSSRLLEAL